MTDPPPTGRTLATRRAIVDVVRSAVLTSYGVTGLTARGPSDRLLARLGLREPGIRVRLDRGLEIDLFVAVGYGLPIAEVARQIDSTVRYAVGRAFERDIRRLTVHVGGLRYQPASVPPTKEPPRGPAVAEAGLQLPTASDTVPPPTGPADDRNGTAPPGADEAVVPARRGGRRARRREDGA